ncbi:hypothetical protein AC249_AIPGENE17543 [Exaiptasia diaphana]|nr:hypothetical protein AC249_AIPGENE17543 [Exaiptasia diaphana]
MASEKILMVVLAVVFGLIQAGELPENDPSGYYRPPCKWGSWSKCSKTCGGGTQQRKCTYEYPYGRRTPYYPNYRVQTRPCNTNCCPENILVSVFEDKDDTMYDVATEELEDPIKQ